MHSNWRDCKAWESYGVKLNTTSDEACKFFDASVTQLVGLYNDMSVGGLEGSLQKTLAADPDFVMGHVIKNGILLLTGAATGASLKKDLDNMCALADKQTTLNPLERQHVQAVKAWSEGQMSRACDKWEEILMYNPHDILATKFVHDTHFYLGQPLQLRDTLARVVPQWKETMPLYGYLQGMYSFGLVETNMFTEAEKVARKGLRINPRDAWSTHSVSHVFTETGKHEEGNKFMASTEKDWAQGDLVATHNYWHWAVHLMDKGDKSGSKAIWDNYLFNFMKSSGGVFHVADTCSMLKRLEFEGVNCGSEWKDVLEIVRPHIDDHILTYTDNHILLACLGAKDDKAAKQMMDSIKKQIQSGKGDQAAVAKEVGLTICEAFEAYDQGNFAKCVEMMYPIRYKVIKIGGSNVQRDLYRLFLIQAALKSDLPEHAQLARMLCIERQSLQPSSLTDGLMKRCVAGHAEPAGCKCSIS